MAQAGILGNLKYDYTQRQWAVELGQALANFEHLSHPGQSLPYPNHDKAYIRSVITRHLTGHGLDHHRGQQCLVDLEWGEFRANTATTAPFFGLGSRHACSSWHQFRRVPTSASSTDRRRETAFISSDSSAKGSAAERRRASGGDLSREVRLGRGSALTEASTDIANAPAPQSTPMLVMSIS
ncbi:hypothetical protein EHS25_005525 [Saitozyma podzolica]|uniref:Uncharacterized protein n=1 Tax=Saitozyma podzolica TaxID=1890683 RepID=A0A427XXS8_9TREE|nr:hypothetical protein EHS25_005525 [Saitozyma podzolica]